MNKVINLSGKMSVLGVSRVKQSVADEVMKGLTNFYLIKDLLKNTEKIISEKYVSNNSLVTSSASASIYFIARQLKIKLLEKGENRKPIIILPSGHNINYGGPVKDIIEMSGAEVKFIGYSNRLNKKDLEESLYLKPDLAFFVSSHHCVKKNHVEAEEFSQFYIKNGIECAIDIAAEINMWKFVKQKWNFIACSGSKAISGPTSGFILYKDKENKRVFEKIRKGTGRTMKISKGNIFGLKKAVEEYGKEYSKSESEKNINNIIKEIQKFLGKDFIVSKSIEKSRGIERISITSTPQETQLLNNFLMKNNIYSRIQNINLGIVEFDLRQTNKEEISILINVIKKFKGDKND